MCLPLDDCVSSMPALYTGERETIYFMQPMCVCVREREPCRAHPSLLFLLKAPETS